MAPQVGFRMLAGAAAGTVVAVAYQAVLAGVRGLLATFAPEGLAEPLAVWCVAAIAAGTWAFLSRSGVLRGVGAGNGAKYAGASEMREFGSGGEVQCSSDVDVGGRRSCVRSSRFAEGLAAAVLVGLGMWLAGAALVGVGAGALDGRYAAGGPFGLAAFALAAPIAEEIVFRGIALDAMARRMPNSWSGAVCSLLFAASHVPNSVGLTATPLAAVSLVLAFFAGMALCALRFRYDGLLMPIVAHMVANSAALLI